MEPERNHTPGPDETARRLVVCLVADEQVFERFPTAIRYLQIGLIDEPIDTILILPEHSRTESLAGGPTAVLTHRRFQWPMARWTQRAIVAEVQQKIESLRRDGPVIVHCLAGPAAQLATHFADALGADLLLNISATNDIKNTKLFASIDRAAALITPSHLFQRIVMASPLARRPVEVVRLGATTSNAPTAFSAPQRAPTLVFAGALTLDCGVDALLRAAKRILRHHPNLLIFIIGKGPAESQLRHLSDALDLRQTVTFTSRLKHWRPVLEAADIFCLPHSQAVLREEPIHALAAGLAIVAAEDALYDGLTHERTALLFPSGDEVQMADQIQRLLDNPDFARTLAVTAQAHARSHHSIARMVADHVRIYRQLESRGNTIPMSPAR